MTFPKLACCNFITSTKVLKEFAQDHGFDGIDWTLSLEAFSESAAAQRDLACRGRGVLRPLEVRFHCFFGGTGSRRWRLFVQPPTPRQMSVGVCTMLQRVGGRVMTLHVGLGRDTTAGICWDSTVAGLRELVMYAGARVFESVSKIWHGDGTSRPALYEKGIYSKDRMLGHL